MMPVQAKILAGFVVVIITGIGIWYLYHAGYQAGKSEVQVQWDADKIKRDEAEKNTLLAYANRIKEAEVQHDQDQAVIDRLHDDAGRVRIHLPTCPQANSDQNGEARALSGRVDQVFADFTTRVGRLIQECDELNINAIRLNSVLEVTP